MAVGRRRAGRKKAAEPAPAEPAAGQRASREWTGAELAAVAVVALLGLVLRFHDLTKAPLITDNADELQFTWAGLNMLVKGDAYTWSHYAAYPSVTVYSALGTTFPMVHHWLDHPPLFSLVMGVWVWLLGDRTIEQVTAEQIRMPPALFSAVTVVLAYWLGRELLGRLPALAGALLLATAPAAVLLGRQAEPESLQAVLLLASLLATLKLVRDREAPPAGAAAVLLACALAAPLMKVTGVAVGGICGAVLLLSGRWKLGAAALGVAAAGVALFVLYGWLVDWTVFVKAWKIQTGNRVSVLSAYDFITSPAGANRRLQDGWWILGWIGVGAWLVTRRGLRELLLAWPVAAYAAAMLVMAGERQAQQYGWYRVIVYPEVYLAGGYLVWLAVAAPTLSRLSIVLVLGGATATDWWLGAAGSQWNPDPLLLTGILLAVLLPAGLAAWRSRERALLEAARWAALAALALMVLGNILESLDLASLLTRL